MNENLNQILKDEEKVKIIRQTVKKLGRTTNHKKKIERYLSELAKSDPDEVLEVSKKYVV